jgi:deoxycytidine triphosphate deaminase
VYLSDRDLRDLLPQLRLRGDDPSYSFDADEQIQPCSIDLRLSNVFWKPRRRAHWLRRLLRRGITVDLRRAQLQEITPHRDWKRVELREGDSITISPGQVLMGRIYERFAIPPEYAGKVEGRSSFSRLGLMVHCTGDFINPGWSGFMPLQLFNASPFPIRVLPYLPICQLKIVSLSSRPDRTYGDPELQSKYVNDDGGPSYWWRDRRVRKIHERLGQVNVPDRIQNEIVGLVRFRDPDLLERFERFVGDRRTREVENADAILDGFSQKEDRRRWRDRLCAGPFSVGLAATVGGLFAPVGLWQYIAWAVTVLGVPPALYAVDRRDADYLGRRELERARANQPPQDDARASGPTLTP